MNISKIVQKLEEIEADTHGEGRDKINSLIEELIELDIRLEKGFKQVLSKEKERNIKCSVVQVTCVHQT